MLAKHFGLVARGSLFGRWRTVGIVKGGRCCEYMGLLRINSGKMNAVIETLRTTRNLIIRPSRASRWSFPNPMISPSFNKLVSISHARMPSLFLGGPLGQRPLTPITTQQRFRRLLVNWVADSDIPFRVVEHQYFRDLLSILNTDQTDCLLPKSQNTLRAWMRTEYEIHLYTIKSALLATPYPILLAHLNPHLPPAQIQYLQFIRRVRCLGHILNLVARAFLDGENKETINRLAEGSAERLSAEQERKLLIAWCETGPVGKLHYLVHFARRTPQRRDAFTDFT